MTSASAGDAYSLVAGEYYDRARHPTCAAFREASAALLDRCLPDVPASSCVEVGTGRSLLAPAFDARGEPLDGLLLTDTSEAMLAHSERWRERGARLAVAPADSLPIADRSAEFLLASLADPYDDERFWREVSRVLTPSGRALVTLPSWEWASRFRDAAGDLEVALFELADGRRLEVPSLIRPPDDELALIAGAALAVVEALDVTLADLSATAPKLDVLQAGEPVVTGYLCRPLS